MTVLHPLILYLYVLNIAKIDAGCSGCLVIPLGPLLRVGSDHFHLVKAYHTFPHMFPPKKKQQNPPVKNPIWTTMCWYFIAATLKKMRKRWNLSFFYWILVVDISIHIYFLIDYLTNPIRLTPPFSTQVPLPQLFVGTLRGFDQSSNVVLSDCQERVFDTDKGVEQVPLLAADRFLPQTGWVIRVQPTDFPFLMDNSWNIILKCQITLEIQRVNGDFNGKSPRIIIGGWLDINPAKMSV